MRPWRDSVSECRDELKGFAILWIVYFHCGLTTPPWLYLFKQLGSGGVDIFLFLSGFGLYRSLQANSDLRRFWLRRCGRVLPSYLPFLALWLVYIVRVTPDMTTTGVLKTIAGNLFMNGFWLDSGKVFNWFAGAQFFYYLLAPFVFAALRRSKRPLLTGLLLIALCFGVGVANYNQLRLMGASRLPIFVAGMLLAVPLGIRWKRRTARVLLATGALLAVGLMYYLYAYHDGWLYPLGLYWYPHLLIAPALTLLLSWLLGKLSGLSWLRRALRFLGNASFEIFLVHIWFDDMAERSGVTGDLQWLCVIAASLLVGVLYHRVVEVARCVATKRFAK